MKNKMGLSIKLILAIFAIVIIGILVPKEVRADSVLASVCEQGDYVNYPISIGGRTINTSWRVFSKSGTTVKLISAVPVEPTFGILESSYSVYNTNAYYTSVSGLKNLFSKSYNGEYLHLPKRGDPVTYNFLNSTYASSWSLTPVGGYEIGTYLGIEDEMNVSSEIYGYMIVKNDKLYHISYNGTSGHAQAWEHTYNTMGICLVRPIITLKSGITTSGLNTSGTWVLSVPTPTTPTTPTTTTEKGLRVNPNGGTWNSSTATQKFTQSTGTTKTIANPIAPSGKTVAFNYNGGIQGTLSMRTNSFVGWTFAGGGTFNNGVYTFADVGGTLNAEYSGNNIILPSAIRYGFEFLGWYTAQTGGTRVGGVGDSYTPSATTVLYAQWQFSGNAQNAYDTETMAKITVDPNGGIWEGSTQKQVFIQNFDTTMNIPNPTAPNGNIVAFNYNGAVQGQLKTEINLTFKGWIYTYGDNEGTLTANYDGNMITLPTTSKIGFLFDGWYTDKLAGTRVGGAGDLYTPKGTELLYAHWKTTELATATLVLNGTADKTNFSLLAMADSGEYEISNYKFYVDGSLYKTVTTSEKQVVCEVTDRTEGTSYNCYVVVTNSEGQTKQSNTATVKTASTISTTGQSNILAERCEIGDYVKYGNETDWRVLSKTSEGVTIIKSNLIAKIKPVYNGYDNSAGIHFDNSIPKMEEFAESYLATKRRTDSTFKYELMNKAASVTVNYFNSNFADYYRLAPTKDELINAQQVILCDSGYESGYWLATYRGEELIAGSTSSWMRYAYTVEQDTFSKGSCENNYYIRPVVKLKDNLKTTGKDSNGIWQLVPNETDANALTVTFALTGSSGSFNYAVATVTGGNGPYTYQLSDIPDNQAETDPIKTNSKTYTYTIGSPGSTYRPRVTVTDSWGREAISNEIIVD